MIDKNLVFKKIKLMEKDLEDLKPLSKYSFDELAKKQYLYLASERLLEKIINRAVDINTHIVVRSGLNPPVDYRDSFLKMAELKVFPKKFMEKIILSIGLRNRLVHEYDDLDKTIIHQSLFDATKEYPLYLKYILKFLEYEKN